MDTVVRLPTLLVTLSLAVVFTLSSGASPGIAAVSARGAQSTRAVLAAGVTPSIALRPTAVQVGRLATLSGTSGPAYAGRPVALQRWARGAWREVGRHTLDAHGGYSFGLRWRTRGSHRYRAVVAGHASASVRLEVFVLHTYRIATDGRVVVATSEFARTVAATYSDPRGWRRAHVRFVQVRAGGQLTVVLAEAGRLPTYSSVCTVRYSCRVGRYVVVNQDRWRFGAAVVLGQGGTLADYRRQVVEHETGHWLGLRHQRCGGAGTPAPVMQQQSISLAGCRPNPWPLRAELARVP